MGGQALMEQELEDAPRPGEVRGAISALAVLTVLLLMGGLVSAVVVDRRSGDGTVSIATLRAAASRVERARSLHITLDFDASFGGSTVRVGMVADVDNVTQQGRLRLETATGTIDAVIDGNRAFVTVPPEERAAVGGKTCVVVDVPADQVANAGAPTAADGKALLGYIAGATGQVRDLGPENLDGVATHKYSVDVDLAEVVSRLPEEKRAGAGLLTSLTGQATIPYELWLDGDDVVRQIRVKIEGGGGSAATTVGFDPSDEPVTVDIPPDGACLPLADFNAAVALVTQD
jgi:hypothetical protein